jgi:hypothetical protein
MTASPLVLNIILLLLIVEAVLVLTLIVKQCLQNQRTDAAIAAINEDLVEMDADIEEVFDYLFPEGVKEGNHASDEPTDQG